MKIKLSKTGHPTIISSIESQEDSLKVPSISASQSLKHKDLLSFKESTLKVLKKSHSEVSIESTKDKTTENAMSDLHNKRKEITVAPLEAKKQKLESNLSQMLPDISIHSVTPANKEQQRQKLQLETKSGNISQQQMNVINEEISITQVVFIFLLITNLLGTFVHVVNNSFTHNYFILFFYHIFFLDIVNNINRRPTGRSPQSLEERTKRTVFTIKL